MIIFSEISGFHYSRNVDNIFVKNDGKNMKSRNNLRNIGVRSGIFLKKTNCEL